MANVNEWAVAIWFLPTVASIAGVLHDRYWFKRLNHRLDQWDAALQQPMVAHSGTHLAPLDVAAMLKSKK